MKRIPLTRGGFALVDECDFDELSRWRWHLSSGYPTRSIRGGKITKHQRMHTVLLGTKMVDHKNGNKLDNRRLNLRPCTKSVNNRNRVQSNVSWHKRAKKWQITMSYQDKTLYFGLFEDREEACGIASLLKGALIYHELTKGTQHGLG